MIAAALIAQAAAVVLPYPWFEACWRAQDATCRVETVAPVDLAYINKMIAEAIADETDEDPMDTWEAFPASRRGDCDDHTMTARATLLTLGVPAADMRIVIGDVIEPDGRIVGHMVLEVTRSGRVWVMDRKTPDRIYPPAERPYAWRETARQSVSAVIWEARP